MENYRWTEEDERELVEYERDLWWSGFAWGALLTVLFFAFMWNCGGRS